MFFAPKCADVRIGIPPYLKMSALENPPDCGRLLWTAPNFSLILLIFLAKLVYVKIETAKVVAFDRVT